MPLESHGGLVPGEFYPCWAATASKYRAGFLVAFSADVVMESLHCRPPCTCESRGDKNCRFNRFPDMPTEKKKPLYRFFANLTGGAEMQGPRFASQRKNNTGLGADSISSSRASELLQRGSCAPRGSRTAGEWQRGEEAPPGDAQDTHRDWSGRLWIAEGQTMQCHQQHH